jgi:hypothetical protein
MTEPTPELRALAAKLFAAARAERPAPALGRRLLLIDPSRDGSMAPRQTSPGRDGTASGPRRIAPSRLAFWLAAAALLAAGIGARFALEPRPPAIAISAERVTGTARGAERAPSRAVAEKEGYMAHRPARMEGATESPPAESPSRPHAIGSSSPSPRLEARPANETRAPATGRRPPAKAPQKAPRAAIRPLVGKEIVQAPAALAEAPVETRPAPAAQGAGAASSETSSLAAPRSLSLRDELQLLGQARARLRAGEARLALELLERHTRERDNGGLDAEATLLRIETYAALGRADEASALATRFVSENPDSALGDRARSFIRSMPARTP